MDETVPNDAARGGPVGDDTVFEDTVFEDTVASVDLGSNSFHMIVARPEGPDLKIVDRLREMVRLAAGLDDKNQLSTEAQERALACLTRFGERLRHLPTGRVRAVGTNTLRRAHNARDFLSAAEQALGHPIETISGIEEARLVYLGVARSVPDRGLRRLVIDIGGGSTELIIGRAESTLELESLYLGCVLLSRAYFDDGVVSAKRWKKAELNARLEFEAVSRRYRDLGWEEAIGASGTVRAVDSVIREAGWSREGITLEALEKLRDLLLKAGRVDRFDIAGLSPERAPVFAGGVVILLTAFEMLGIDRMIASDGALREGLLHDLLGRMRDSDIRSASVSALGDRYVIDAEQAARVKTTALALLAQTGTGGSDPDGEAHLLLGWAAELHEVGLSLAHAQYHKHGEYIVAQSDLNGFSREEQRALATLVRAHRRKFPSAVLGTLSARRISQATRLALILRLAVILHRNRGGEPQPVPTLKIGERKVTVRFPAGWLDRHPLTDADLQRERDYLDQVGYQLKFR